MENQKSKIIVIKEANINLLIIKLKNCLKKFPDVKFIVVTELKQMDNFQKIKTFPVLDILSINEAHCDKKIDFLMKKIEVFKKNSEEIQYVDKEKKIELVISKSHIILLGLAICYLFITCFVK
jgi:hypothetical protein